LGLIKDYSARHRNRNSVVSTLGTKFLNFRIADVFTVEAYFLSLWSLFFVNQYQTLFDIGMQVVRMQFWRDNHFWSLFL